MHPTRDTAVLNVSSAFRVVSAAIIALVSLGVAHRVWTRRAEEPGVWFCAAVDVEPRMPRGSDCATLSRAFNA